jgi:hypothetical protein
LKKAWYRINREKDPKGFSVTYQIEIAFFKDLGKINSGGQKNSLPRGYWRRKNWEGIQKKYPEEGERERQKSARHPGCSPFPHKGPGYPGPHISDGIRNRLPALHRKGSRYRQMQKAQSQRG